MGHNNEDARPGEVDLHNLCGQKISTMTNCGKGRNCLHTCHPKMCGTTPDLSN